ncbi:hypothetical protein Cantr_06742 [Candida viswanathii]|uniref:DNA/RNA-binding protein Alba-like domain-containing protein n=1 Tax=Candida viswanathii TaxID=5486 RepID=A0A367XWG3_9ASCO|nr:hypothetical protein Cantr_06742 [Candida viswanathii]
MQGSNTTAKLIIISSINHMSKSTLDSEYTAQLNTVQRELQQKLSKDEALKLFKITKNDSIKKKVEAILKYVDQGEIVLLSSLSNGIPKLIAIVEIVKQKQSEFYQYNMLLKIESTTNPDYKPKKDDTTKQGKSEKAVDEKQVLEEINGPKLFTLPVMYVLLTKKASLESVELMSWTKQPKK